MPQTASHALTRQKLSIDFVTLQHACPKGVYAAPVPDEPLLWKGVVFVRKGPYANAVLRFQIVFPDDYPARPPVVSFLSDVFHPLIAPLTTYTYTARDRTTEGISAAEEERLPPGGLILRHGFPEWYEQADRSGDDVFSESTVKSEVTVIINDTVTGDAATEHPVDPADGTHEPAQEPGFDTDPTTADTATGSRQVPHIIEILQYMRIILDTEFVIDSVPLDLAANPGAWHAWRSYRSKVIGPQQLTVDSKISSSRESSMSPSKSQPGGARRPAEWNWAGVWEDRVKKAVQTSISEATLYGSDGNSEIEFTKLNDEIYQALPPVAAARTQQTV